MTPLRPMRLLMPSEWQCPCCGVRGTAAHDPRCYEIPGADDAEDWEDCCDDDETGSEWDWESTP